MKNLTEYADLQQQLTPEFHFHATSMAIVAFVLFSPEDPSRTSRFLATIEVQSGPPACSLGPFEAY